MKTLKQFLEVHEPKSPDEKRFKDKHVTIKHPDRNGNGDDVFQATNVKKAERTKERHGYEPGEDEKVYEEKDMPFEGPYRDVGERKDKYGNPIKNVAKHLAKKAMNAQKNEDVSKGLPDHLKKHFDKDGNPIKGSWKDGKWTRNKDSEYQVKDVTPKGYGPNEDVSESVAFAAAKKYGTPKEEVVVEEVTADEAVAQIFESGVVHKLYQPALLNIFEQLSDENQMKFAEQLQTPEGVESLINFAIQNRDK